MQLKHSPRWPLGSLAAAFAMVAARPLATAGKVAIYRNPCTHSFGRATRPPTARTRACLDSGLRPAFGVHPPGGAWLGAALGLDLRQL